MYLEVGWMCWGVQHSWKTASKWVCYWLQTRTVQRLSCQYQTVLETFLGFTSLFIAVQKERATPPHIHPMSRYVIVCDQFYQAFPHDTTANNAGVRRSRYEAKKHIYKGSFFSIMNLCIRAKGTTIAYAVPYLQNLSACMQCFKCR